MLTQERLKYLLFYDKDAGGFIRNVSTTPNTKVGEWAGTFSKIGYVYISVDGKRYLAHRLIWLWLYGYFPKNQIDHINRIRSDNRLVNLREVTKSINSINTPVRSHSQIGHKNIKLDKRDSTYSVAFVRNKKEISFGRFKDLNQAISIRNEVCNLL
jgi:hypothetical protein